MRILATITCAMLASTVMATEPAPSFETLMTKPGKLQWKDELKDKLGSDWTVAKGKWTPQDGALTVAELKEDMHGAVARRKVEGRDLIVQYSVKLDGAKTTSLSINAAKGHVCRLIVRPTGFVVQKDDTDGKNGPDKAEVLQTVDTPVKAGEWHTFIIEMSGTEMLARMDGKLVAFGTHKAIDTAKANIGFTCAGEHAAYKNVMVWSAEPNSQWSETKAKLLKEKTR